MPPKKSRGGRRPAAGSRRKKPDLTNVKYAEKFIGKRKINGRIEMLVKWVNIPINKSTWEPLTSCSNCLCLFEEFEVEQFIQRGDTEYFLEDLDCPSEPNEPEDSWSCSSMSSLRVSPDPPKVVRRKKRAPRKKTTNKDVDEDYIPSDGTDLPIGFMAPYRGEFGLARGLELDRVVHSYRVNDARYMFVQWKGYSGTDVVPIDELRDSYPEKIIEYFENLRMNDKNLMNE